MSRRSTTPRSFRSAEGATPAVVRGIPSCQQAVSSTCGCGTWGCVYATAMDAATTLRRAREDAGLSVSALARRAGVPTSTASRVEAGTLDPTITMISRLLAAAGQRLCIDDTPISRSLSVARLATAALGQDSEPNWVEIRHLVDRLEHEPDWIHDAIETPPPRSDNVGRFLANGRWSPPVAQMESDTANARCRETRQSRRP